MSSLAITYIYFNLTPLKTCTLLIQIPSFIFNSKLYTNSTTALCIKNLIPLTPRKQKFKHRKRQPMTSAPAYNACVNNSALQPNRIGHRARHDVTSRRRSQKELAVYVSLSARSAAPGTPWQTYSSSRSLGEPSRSEPLAWQAVTIDRGCSNPSLRPISICRRSSCVLLNGAPPKMPVCRARLLGWEPHTTRATQRLRDELVFESTAASPQSARAPPKPGSLFTDRSSSGTDTRISFRHTHTHARCTSTPTRTFRTY